MKCFDIPRNLSIRALNLVLSKTCGNNFKQCGKNLAQVVLIRVVPIFLIFLIIPVLYVFLNLKWSFSSCNPHLLKEQRF